MASKQDQAERAIEREATAIVRLAEALAKRAADTSANGGDWADAGTLGHVTELLGQASDFLFGRDEGKSAGAARGERGC
jgi:hypothetical protein